VIRKPAKKKGAVKKKGSKSKKRDVFDEEEAVDYAGIIEKKKDKSMTTNKKS
jgi:hypothetical protein